LTNNNPILSKDVRLDDADNPFRLVGMFSYKHGKYKNIPIKVVISKSDKQIIMDRVYFPSPSGVGGTRKGGNIITFYNYGRFTISEDGIYKINISLMSTLYNFNEFYININKSSNSIYIFFHIIAVIFFFFSIFYRKEVFTKGVLRIVPYFFLLLIGIFPLLLYFV
jgi:hypothetical protein